MTWEEGIKALYSYCEAETKSNRWEIFRRKIITFEANRILQAWEKEANLPLPDHIASEFVRIDKHGIIKGYDKYEWVDVCASGLKKELLPIEDDEALKYDYYLLICLHTHDIIELYLGAIDQYYGLLGHYIEQYRLHSKG